MRSRRRGILKRLQLLELCDQPWVKGVLREGYMDCLNNIHRLLQPYHHIAPVLARWAERLGGEEILDVASGGGEQVSCVVRSARLQGMRLPRLVLSDLFPDAEAYRSLVAAHGESQIGFIAEPVSVAQLPPRPRLVTIFSAFHHLPPEVASALLRDAAAHLDGLCIVEFTRRCLFDLLSMLPAFFLNALAPFFATRFRWSKVVLCSLIPLIAVMVVFDGIVSVLRSYTVDEVIAMLPPEARDLFLAECGEVAWGRLPLARSTYVLLLRRSSLRSAPGDAGDFVEPNGSSPASFHTEGQEGDRATTFSTADVEGSRR